MAINCSLDDNLWARPWVPLKCFPKGACCEKYGMEESTVFASRKLVFIASPFDEWRRMKKKKETRYQEVEQRKRTIFHHIFWHMLSEKRTGETRVHKTDHCRSYFRSSSVFKRLFTSSPNDFTAKARFSIALSAVVPFVSAIVIICLSPIITTRNRNMCSNQNL